MGTKTCTRCYSEKPVEQFSRSRIARDGYHTWCKACKVAQTKRWYADNAEARREIMRRNYAVDGTAARAQARQWYQDNKARSKESKANWKLRRYGLNIEQYDAMVRSQGGLCAICGAPPTIKKIRRPLAVDHCHETGAVRGLLCHQCNVGLGHFEDSPELLQAAIAYLLRARR